MTTNDRRNWKVLCTGLLLGSLAALGASGQVVAVTSSAVPTTASSVAATSQAIAVERRVVLSDGAPLILSADGRTLSLRDARTGREVRHWVLAQERRGASLTVLASGRVLIWGGHDARGRVQAGGAWFDPSLKALAPVDDMPLTARAGHTATVLTDGRVLLAGGTQEGHPAEVWDERRNTVQAVAAFAGADHRQGHGAQLQADGWVRLQGGRGLVQAPLAPEALFDPATATFTADTASAPVSPTPPVSGLAGSWPVQGARSVDPRERLVIRFAQPVRVSELDAAHVVLRGPAGATALRTTPVEGGRLVFVTPEQALFPGSKYTLMVDGVHAAESGKLLPLMVLDFTTAVLGADEAAGTDADAGSMASAVVPSTGKGAAAGKGCRSATGRLGPCRAQAELKDGVWTPGQDNTEGRWRVVGSQPVLPDTRIGSRLMQAMGFNAVSGQVRQVDGVPVAGAEVMVAGLHTHTNDEGRFTLYNVPAGHQEVYVDGSTANRPGVEYGQFVVGADVQAGTMNQLGYTMYLPRISARDKVSISSPLQQDVVLTHPDMPGLMVQIPAGTVIRDRKGRLVRELALVPTPVNRAPFPVAENYPMYFTIEPGGAVVQGLTPESAVGIRVFYPNYDGHPTGTQANFWVYDAQEGWRVYGQGRVTTDGTVFSPEAGVALQQTMGGSYSVNTNTPPTEDDSPENPEDCNCQTAGSGSGSTTGDPIDLRTGQFFYAETDIAISDVLPITLARDYRPHDAVSHEFGVGTRADFGYTFYAPPGNNYDQVQIVLPRGMAVPFQRVSGSGLSGTWQQAGTRTVFEGATLHYLGDALGTGFRLKLADGGQMHFNSYAPNRLMWQMDRHGNRIDYVLDAGLVTQIVSSSGRSIDLEYDGNKRISAASDLLGNTWHYAYNASGLLSQVTYPDGSRQRYEYETLVRAGVSHALVRVYDRNEQLLLSNTYGSDAVGDAANFGRVIRQTQADGGVIRIDYGHTVGADTGVLVTRADGSQRRLTYADDGRYPQTDTDAYGTPLARTYTFERDGAERLTARIDPLGRRTEYTYDSAGRTLRTVQLAGTAQARTVSASYTAEGDLASVTDPLGRTTWLTYSNGCLATVTNPRGDVIRLSCNSAGQPTRVTDPLGRTTWLAYQGYDLSQVVDPQGRITRFRHDVLGRVIAVEDPQGNVQRVEYDALGRVQRQTDALGRQTEVGYDGNGNVLAVLLPHGNGVTYTYDERDRQVSRTDPLGQVERWTYDALDRPLTHTDRSGRVTSYSYDVLGRRTTTTYSDGSTATVQYDAGDRLLQLVDSATGTLAWSYDDWDQVLSAQTAQGTIAYEYDAIGRRIGMTPAQQAKVEYRYDDLDRLTRILQGSEAVAFAYDKIGRLLETTLPNGVQTGYAYSDSDEVTGIAWKKADGSLIGDLGYAYNDVGQRIVQTGSYAPQLLPQSSTGSFDDNFRQTGYNGQALSYDANGNLLGDGQRTYVWNARDQLVEIRQGGSIVASFQYDALGRRIGKTEGGQSVSYLYDGLDAVQETHGNTVLPILAGAGIDQRFARTDNAGRTYFLTDAQGSTRALTDANGNVVQRYDYSPYGETQASGTGFSNPYQYTGRERDQSGLYYYRARYYDEGMKRFIAEDPIGLAGGINWYAYVSGDPVNFIDALGLNRANAWNDFQRQYKRQNPGHRLSPTQAKYIYRQLGLNQMGRDAEFEGAMSNFPDPLKIPDMNSVKCDQHGYCIIEVIFCKCPDNSMTCPVQPGFSPMPKDDPSCFCEKKKVPINL